MLHQNKDERRHIVKSRSAASELMRKSIINEGTKAQLLMKHDPMVKEYLNAPVRKRSYFLEQTLETDLTTSRPYLLRDCMTAIFVERCRNGAFQFSEGGKVDASIIDNYVGERVSELNIKTVLDETSVATDTAKAMSLFTPEVLTDPKLFDSFRSNSPFVVYSGLNKVLSPGGNASFIENSNLIIVAKELKEKNEATRVQALVHELAHYTSSLGRKTRKSIPFNEGMTEYIALTLSGKNKFKTTIIAYENDVLVSLILAKLVGDELLRHTYFTGNIRKLAREVDGVLFPGAYRGLYEIASEKRLRWFIVGSLYAAYNGKVELSSWISSFRRLAIGRECDDWRYFGSSYIDYWNQMSDSKEKHGKILKELMDMRDYYHNGGAKKDEEEMLSGIKKLAAMGVNIATMNL